MYIIIISSVKVQTISWYIMIISCVKVQTINLVYISWQIMNELQTSFYD